MNIFARIFAVLFAALSLTSCGKDIGTVDALKTEHFSVSDAMLSYTLYDTYYYYIDTYGDEGLMAYFGLDTTKSLKKQVSLQDCQGVLRRCCIFCSRIFQKIIRQINILPPI